MANEAVVALGIDIPSHWKRCSLGAVASVEDGDWIETKDQGGSDYRLLQVSNVDVGSFRETGNFRWISQETFDRLSCREVLHGDILVARMPEPTGRACRFRAKDHSYRAVTAVDVAIVRPDPQMLESAFLCYFLNSPANLARIESLATGTTRMRVRRADLARLEVPAPPLAEQYAIVGALCSLDDKIEQNRRTARALERLARAIFRAWFVDFEPVKAKASGATAFPSMPQPVFDALPTRFVDSYIGAVPEGWEVKAIASVGTFLNGLALQKYPPRGDGRDLPVIKIAELRKGSTDGSDLANNDVPEQYVVGDRDLLFSWSGTLEAEFWFGGKGALNQHLFKVTSSHFPSWFCLLWIRQHLPWFRAIAASKATTMGHIKRGHLQEAQVVVPPTAVVREADQMVGALYDLHAQLMIESRRLAAMRDYLLPKLLSGQVQVEAADG